jgi:PhnB protein
MPGEHTQPKVNPIPDGHNRVTPFVVLRGAAGFIGFMKEVFSAEEIDRQEDEQGTIIHSEIRIGDSVLMPIDSEPDWPEMFMYLAIYVEDCDKPHQDALDAGALEITPLEDSPWGDRGCRVLDPWGNIWA